MRHGLIRIASSLAACMALTGPAMASSPTEKITCTHLPRSQWLPEARIRAIFGEDQFTLVKFKVSRGNCYEFYAVHHDGSIVEAYYHPVTGESVRYNRVTVKAAEPGYRSSTAAPAR